MCGLVNFKCKHPELNRNPMIIDMSHLLLFDFFSAKYFFVRFNTSYRCFKLIKMKKPKTDGKLKEKI